MNSADPDPTRSDPLAVTVALLRHESSDRSQSDADHLDLFVGPRINTDPNARVLHAWRLPLAAWGAEGLVSGRFAVSEAPPHRAEYLTLTVARELSSARGRITPLSRGAGVAVVKVDGDGDRFVIRALGRTITLTPSHDATSAEIAVEA